MNWKKGQEKIKKSKRVVQSLNIQHHIEYTDACSSLGFKQLLTQIQTFTIKFNIHTDTWMQSKG